MTSVDAWPPVAVAGVGSYVPARVVTNDELVAADGLDTTDDWIVARTGIRERRFAGAGETVADMAAAACRDALAAADADESEIDLVVLATSTPMWSQPATATAVHERLGLREDAAAFDVAAVCCGFVTALHAASAMLASSERWMSVIVVGAERYSTFTDPADRGTRVFFGDGAGAVVLRKQLEIADIAAVAAEQAGVDLGAGVLGGLDGGALDEETPGIRSIVYSTDHAGRDALLTPLGERFRMDGPAVRAFAVPALVAATRGACEAAGVDVDELALLVPHQSNLRMLEAAADELGLERERLAVTVDRFGNTAGASIPLTLAAAHAAGQLREGDLVCLTGYGSGLQSAACVVRWGG